MCLSAYLLALSIHTTGFARADHPEIFQCMTLKQNTKRIYIVTI